MHLMIYVHCYAVKGNRNSHISDVERAELLSRLARCVQMSGSASEIGTLFGYSTQEVCEAIIRSCIRETVFAVDTYSWRSTSLLPQNHRAFTSRNLLFASGFIDLALVDTWVDAVSDPLIRRS